MKVSVIIDHKEFVKNNDLLHNRLLTMMDNLKSDNGRDLMVVTDLSIGSSNMVCAAAKRLDIKYGLYLPYHLNETNYNYSLNEVDDHINYADHIFYATTKNTSLKYKSVSYHNMLRDSNFLVSYWDSRHQGNVFKIIKYALYKNIPVLNGLDNLNQVTDKTVK